LALLGISVVLFVAWFVFLLMMASGILFAPSGQMR
jgi:hypothetical protein